MDDDCNLILPPNWTRHYDTNHNSYYYYNHITLETTWILPTFNNISPTNNSRLRLPPIDTNTTYVTESQYIDNRDQYDQQYDHQYDQQYDQQYLKVSPSSTKKPTMPAHMLENPTHAVSNPSEYYSDMDSEDEICSSDDEYFKEHGTYPIPVFSIPEQRGFLPHIHRVPKSPIIGGMNKDYIGLAKTYKQQYANRKTNNNVNDLS